MAVKPLGKSNSWKRTVTDLLILQILFFAALVFLFVKTDIREMSLSNLINLAMDSAAIPMLVLIMLSGLRSKLLDRTVFLFMIIIFVDTVYVFLDAMSMILEGKPKLRSADFAANTGLYICAVVLSWVFWKFLCSWMEDRTRLSRKLTVAVDIVSLAGILVILANIREKFCFYVSPAGYYENGDIFYVSMICPAAVLFLCVLYVLKQKITVTDKIIFISYPLIPLIGAVVDTAFEGPEFLCMMVFLSNVFIYSNMFVRRDETLARRQTELAESKMNNMMLQINPHFIYNTLGSISSLCHEDPDLAENMLYSFSNYLRNNFGEMAHKNLITIEEELEHLEFYINIEKLRFPDINVVLDFKASSFMIPSLSIQPLAENAIKHGIMGRETGGTLKISTYEDDMFYSVCVEDDGVGFDTIEKHDGKNHIGVKNVQKRLEMLCGGTLSISSTKDVGTVAVIKIPK